MMNLSHLKVDISRWKGFQEQHTQAEEREINKQSFLNLFFSCGMWQIQVTADGWGKTVSDVGH